MEIIIGIDTQKKSSISYVWDKAKKTVTCKEVENSSHTQALWTEATIGIVKSTLKIPPQHNGVIPIKITGQAIKEYMAYLITDEDSKKGRDPNINIINNIHNIKEKTSVNVLVSNYTINVLCSTKGNM